MKITLVPRAGLCNRINAIISGLVYQKLHPEAEIDIYWHKSQDCYCRFDDLFKQIPNPFPSVKEMFLSLKIYPGTKYNLYIPNLTRCLFFDYVFTPDNNPDLFESLTERKKNVYVNTYNRFIDYDHHKKVFDEVNSDISKFIRPVDELQLRIDGITKTWRDNVIGLHIRRTDNVDAIRTTPMDYFHGVIRNELSANPDVLFYVATDDASVKKTLFEKYGDRIISPFYLLERGCVQGMKDAVVDLFCLGLTNRIYGSTASSYVKTASKLFNRPLIMA